MATAAGWTSISVAQRSRWSVLAAKAERSWTAFAAVASEVTPCSFARKRVANRKPDDQALAPRTRDATPADEPPPPLRRDREVLLRGGPA